jgi:hypothetical protein
LDLYYIYIMDEIYKKHKYWIGLAYSFGITDFPEDAVQDAYLKIYGKENINESYFYFTLHSICMNMHNKRKLETIPFYDNLDAEDIIPSSPTDITDVLFTLDNWTWDEKLFYLKYIEEELSLRKFALKYHYNYNWVYRTLKELKERLKQIKD